MGDTKISALPTVTSMAETDKIVIVVDPATTPVDKLITLLNLLGGLTLAKQATGFTIAGGTAAKTLTLLSDATIGGTASRILAQKATGGVVMATAAEIMTILGNAALVLGSDADGDMFARISGAMGRIPKGAANTRLFMNAAGTGQEWAAGMYEGTFTIDVSTTGDQAITGVGFKPGRLQFCGGITNSAYDFSSHTNGSAMFIVAEPYTGTHGTKLVSTSYISYYNDGANQGTSVIKTLDSDGFTITKSKINTPTGTLTVGFRALR